MNNHARHIAGAALLLLNWLCAGIISASAGETIEMEVGEVKVLSSPGVARVAVGDGHVLNAVATDEKEVIVFARNEGATSLHVWSEDGRRRKYHVDVAATGARQLQEELREALSTIPGVSVRQVGDRLVVEGDSLGDADRTRVASLAERYPQLLDFTSHVGWEDMVLLDVQVVEIPRSRLQDLGVRWNPATEGGLNAGLAWEAHGHPLPDRPGLAPVPAVFPASASAAYFGVNALLSSRIQAMAQTGEAVMLAQPQLLARSGATAEFLAGGEVPYSSTDSNGNASTEFKSYGVSLRITPQVERNSAIRSRIEVEVSSIDPSLSVPNGPSLKTRRAVTEFNVKSGQTLVIAGFISREDSRNVDKVPALGDVPFLGGLFRATRKQRQETELAVFVTPVVVSPGHPDMARRVANAQGILDEAFPDPPRLNTSIDTLAVPAAASQAGWWAGAGGQWTDNAGQAVLAGNRRNLVDYEEDAYVAP
ncbi:type II and III secretion system protein family protein [Paracandidimonas soli]|uniref:Pilus assembly protein CpaC n=1 Tax=Paracandidimonas soli TaxID=1917182 RepID=A0A4R3V9G8_9BURK|nr:pilus assembly protein N-terminal domain-containing protein [Paracandidimonas soli]TCV01867.1 pilus assembly protein CpaC [Paracandidimonas soli]